MEMRIRTNHDDDYLYCVWCKNRVELGERYALISEEIYGDEIVNKGFHLECVPEEDELEDE